MTTPTVPTTAILTQFRADAEEITVDTLVISHALTAFADDQVPASRAVELAVAKAHLQSAQATVAALPDQAMTAAGSTASVRDTVTTTLAGLAGEVNATIACEQTKTPACGSAPMIARQSQAGAAAGAAVFELLGSARIPQQFVTAASTIVQQNFATGTALNGTLNTLTLRKAATALAASTLPTPPTPSPTPGR